LFKVDNKIAFLKAPQSYNDIPN
jgi:hypothetical protein